ncbi:MAG: histidine triad nucleotide-binding protein [Firmicutes bacterium]|nr:histidine triad nucleotide-binding protein [Bacillota bacterium]
MSCLFCKIAAGEIPSNVIYEDDDVFAFHDISPQAPTHFLVIPKKHIESVMHSTAEEQELLGKLMAKIPEIAKKAGIDGTGVRVVSNSGADAGQSVFHLHFHVLSGRKFGWPPG